MNKKTIIITVVVTLFVVVGSIIAADFFSRKTVTLSITKPGVGVEIYQDENKVASRAVSGDIRLKPGDYRYKVIGDNYAENETDFSVQDSNVTLVVDPAYSETYLRTLLEREGGAIDTALDSKYSALNTQFIKDSIVLVGDGTWATGRYVQIVDPRDSPDIYRFVLKKESGEWNIVVPPQIAIEKEKYKDVPESILEGLY